jgi:hypothetical protein
MSRNESADGDAADAVMVVGSSEDSASVIVRAPSKREDKKIGPGNVGPLPGRVNLPPDRDDVGLIEINAAKPQR